MNNDDVIQNKKKKYLTIGLDNDIIGKVDYIIKRTGLSKRQVIMMCASPNIDALCKKLMDEELLVRKSSGQGALESSRLPKRLKLEDVPHGTLISHPK